MTRREREILNIIIDNPLISQGELADKLGIARSSIAVHISNLMKQGYIVGKGYITRTNPYVVVVGGLNIDIVGSPHKKIIHRDSNPGKVTRNLGGVGRNIAHNICLLGIDVRLLTAFGDDLHAADIAASCGNLGIDISNALQIPGEATSTYLCVNDSNGDMAVGISDMDIYKYVTPEYLSSKQKQLEQAHVIIVDTNIPEESINWICNNCSAPVFVDPVSTTKALKIKKCLGKINTLKPNRIEAEILSGIKINDNRSLDQAVDALLSTGLERVFISLGADGVYAADHNERIKIPCYKTKYVSMTGCGDAFMGGIVWAYLQGSKLREAALAGNAAASLSIESKENVNPVLDEDLLRTRINCFYSKIA